MPSPAVWAVISLRKRLFGLETSGIAGVGTAIGQSFHDFVHIRADVLGGILKVILHDIVGIQAELRSLLGLLGVVDDKELIGAGVLCQIDAFGAQSIFNP